MLEPCVCVDSVYPAEDVCDLFHLLCEHLVASSRAHAHAAVAGAEAESRRKELAVAKSRSGPVERVAAVVDGRAGLRGVVDGAKVLPFGSSHFVACCRRASWSVGEEGNDNRVGLLDQKAAQLVQPDFFGSVMRWVGELSGEVGGYGVGRCRVGRMCE